MTALALLQPCHVPLDLALALADPVQPVAPTPQTIAAVLERLDAIEARVGLSPTRPHALSLAAIQMAVCAHYGLDRNALLAPRRDPVAMEARRIGLWLSRRLTTKSLPQIGRAYGREHSTVLSTIRITDRRLKAEAGAGPLTAAAAAISAEIHRTSRTEGDH